MEYFSSTYQGFVLDLCRIMCYEHKAIRSHKRPEHSPDSVLPTFVPYRLCGLNLLDDFSPALENATSRSFSTPCIPARRLGPIAVAL